MDKQIIMKMLNEAYIAGTTSGYFKPAYENDPIPPSERILEDIYKKYFTSEPNITEIKFEYTKEGTKKLEDFFQGFKLIISKDRHPSAVAECMIMKDDEVFGKIFENELIVRFNFIDKSLYYISDTSSKVLSTLKGRFFNA